MGEVEGEHVQFPAIHNQDFAVIADQVSRCARDCDATLQKPHFELPQTLFATVVSECDQGMYKQAALDSVNECPLNFRPVKTKDHDFDTLFGLLDCLDYSIDPIRGLNEKFQKMCLPPQL